jgi:hypothetical protein
MIAFAEPTKIINGSIVDISDRLDRCANRRRFSACRAVGRQGRHDNPGLTRQRDQVITLVGLNTC